MSIAFEILMPLPSCANLREHWAARAARSKSQRSLANMAMRARPEFRKPLEAGQSATITLTRIAPRALDSDNLASAFKACRDGIADALGVDDGSPRLEWRYAQEKGAARVRVELQIHHENTGGSNG